jgi:hypothetical protein
VLAIRVTEHGEVSSQRFSISSFDSPVDLIIKSIATPFCFNALEKNKKGAGQNFLEFSRRQKKFPARDILDRQKKYP